MLKRKSLFAAFLLTSLLSAQLYPLLTRIPSHVTGEERFAVRTFDVLSLPKAHAEDVNRSGSSTLESNAQKFFTMTLNVFVVLNWFALMAVQKLLDPDVIFGEPDTTTGVRPMEKILNDLWILSRNIVNAVFAFMLLLGGIYLIVSGEGVEAFLKQRMKNFVLAVILVNFSWFFPRVIIDAANVASAVIYNIPNIINKNLLCIAGPGKDKDIDTKPTDANVHPDDEACKFVYRVVLFPEEREECKVSPPPPPPNDCIRPEPPEGRQFGGLVDIYYADWKTTVLNNGLTYQNDTLPTSPPPGQTVTVPVSGADAVVNGLAVNFANIANLGVIDFKEFATGNSQQTPWKRAGAYMQFFLHLIIHLVLSVVVGLALLAFAVVLIVRMGVLWLCIAFMPFIFVGYAIGKGLGELGEQAGGLNIWKKFISYAFLPAFVAIPFAVGFTLISQLYYIKVFSKVGIFENLGFMPNIDDFHQILWMLIAIAIIWKGVFGVLERTDDIAKGIVGAIKGIGTTGLTIARQTATAIPFIPTPRGPASVQDVTRGVQRAAYGKGLVEFGKKESPPGTTPPPPATEIPKLTQGIQPDHWKELKNILASEPGKFTERLSQLSQGKISQPQALAMLESPEHRRALVNTSKGHISEEALKKEAEYLRSTRAAGGTVNIGITVKAGVGGQAEARREGAEKAHNALTSASHNLEQVKKALDEKAKDTTLQSLQRQGFEEVLNKITEVERQGKAPKETRDDVLAELAKMK